MFDEGLLFMSTMFIFELYYVMSTTLPRLDSSQRRSCMKHFGKPEIGKYGRSLSGNDNHLAGTDVCKL